MATKRERQQSILHLIDAQAISSQEELRLVLEQRGMVVTQATLSRDLRELGVVRVPTADGARYRPAAQLADDGKPALEQLLPQWFSRIDGVREMIVLHTLASGAQPIAEAIDGQNWPEVLGTLAGENTILIVCRSDDARQILSERLERLAASD